MFEQERNIEQQEKRQSHGEAMQCRSTKKDVMDKTKSKKHKRWRAINYATRIAFELI